MEADCLVVIPARMAGKRFPGKALADLDGHPLIWHPWRAASTWPRAASVVIATPDEEIVRAATAFGALVQHTDPAARNGSQRAFEVFLRNPQYRILVNLQADEPEVDHEMLHILVERVFPAGCDISTLATEFPHGFASADPNEVKVVCGRRGRALYFTRQPIPAVLRHVGAYAFQGEHVAAIARSPESACGRAERLEQLDWVDDSWMIEAVKIEGNPRAVNCPRDLELLKGKVNHESESDPCRIR